VIADRTATYMQYDRLKKLISVFKAIHCDRSVSTCK